MAKLLPPAGYWIRAGLGLAVAASLVCASLPAQPLPALPHGLFASKKKADPQRPPVRATVQPAFSIPVDLLGYSPPANVYIGARNSFASLDFLGEDRLLFTFRVPALIHRSEKERDAGDVERKIRALVLHLPDGAVQAQGVWTLHDRSRYLYPLGDGEFLLRDGATLQVVDASLQLKPWLHFPGPVEWVEVDPSGGYLVTSSDDPKDQPARQGDVNSPAAAPTAITSDSPASAQRNLVLRVLRRQTGTVMLATHIQSIIHLPINDEGYVELLRGNGISWTLNFNYFSGGHTTVGKIDSACMPLLNFLSPYEVLPTNCSSSGDPQLVALGRQRVAFLLLRGDEVGIGACAAAGLRPRGELAVDAREVARELQLAQLGCLGAARVDDLAAAQDNVDALHLLQLVVVEPDAAAAAVADVDRQLTRDAGRERMATGRAGHARSYRHDGPVPQGHNGAARRGAGAVERDGLENRKPHKGSWVRIPPPPPNLR